jgi:wyosine [tRNA(Phe)-imidazoG37] synthetase (radical SAM superfamily)
MGAAPPKHESVSAPAPRIKKSALQPGIIYGPVRSRRLGMSLGINLLPTDCKWCSFNCIYCQYGGSKSPAVNTSDQLQDMPTSAAVALALAVALRRLARARKTVDAITICGNGEPTLHPSLGEIVNSITRLRDRHLPAARLAILSNSSTVGRKAVRDALALLDVKIMKFDAGTEEMFRRLNHSAAPVYMGEIVEGLKTLKNIFIQALFVQGRVSNADPDSVALWLEKVREIRPLAVQVYTLDREPDDKKIEKVSRLHLEWIANQVRWRAGLPAEII